MSAPRGGLLQGGVSALGGLVPGGCLLLGGVCSQGGGVSAPGGCLLWGVSALGGVVSQHGLRQTSPPCGQTDACKNITFATSLRSLKMYVFLHTINC